MRKVRTWQLCRTGVHGADGAEISENDLREIMQTFAPPRPVTIGHDMAKGDAFPKYGDVIAIDGIYPDAKHPGEKVLVGSVALHPELDKLYGEAGEASAYTGWSVTIPRRAADGKRYLHSVAVCGAVPPKIAGLEELMVKREYPKGDTVESVSFAEAIIYQEAMPMTEEEKKKLEGLEAENAALKKKLEEMEKREEEGRKKREGKEGADTFTDNPQMQSMQNRLEQAERELRKNRLERFSDAVNERIPLGIRGQAAAVARALAGAGDVSFSDNGEEKTAAALEAFQEILMAWPQVETRQVYSFSDPLQENEGNGGKVQSWAELAGKL